MFDNSSGREVVSGTRGLSEKGRDQGEEGRREKLKGTSALLKGDPRNDHRIPLAIHN